MYCTWQPYQHTHYSTGNLFKYISRFWNVGVGHLNCCTDKRNAVVFVMRTSKTFDECRTLRIYSTLTTTIFLPCVLLCERRQSIQSGLFKMHCWYVNTHQRGRYRSYRACRLFPFPVLQYVCAVDREQITQLQRLEHGRLPWPHARAHWSAQLG